MSKIALTLAVLLLALPAAAEAKGGVEFETYPDTAKPGQKINFTVMAMDELPPGGGGRTQPQAIVGRHALVTFRSQSGRVVRVRTGATDLNGIASGHVAFPDKGPWTTELHIGDLRLGPEMSEPIYLGIGLTQTTPAANASRSKTTTPDANGFPWVSVLAFGAIGSAVLVLAMRRRGHWGAA
jgi:hypothetical protein